MTQTEIGLSSSTGRGEAAPTPTATAGRFAARERLDVAFYRATYLDLQHLDDAALESHWLTFGRAEGRLPNESVVLELSESLAEAQIDPLTYWIAHPDLGDEIQSATSRALARIHQEKTSHPTNRPLSLSAAGASGISAEVYQRLMTISSELRAQGLEAYAQLVHPEALRELAFAQEALRGVDFPALLVEVLQHTGPILCAPNTVEPMLTRGLEEVGPLPTLLKAARTARDYTRNALLGSESSERKWWLLGREGEFYGPDDWTERRPLLAGELTRREAGWPTTGEVEGSLRNEGLLSPGMPLVSVIVSLYKGSQWIEPFLDSMASQTAIDWMELVIVDAASPDGEWQAIERRLKDFPHWTVIRTMERIPIYQAWNLGLANSTGAFVTNANLDDFRHPRSVELQAYSLATSGDDILYQDYLVSFEGPDQVGFREVVDAGLVDVLPPATPKSLMLHNYIHNSPMWRRALHEVHGQFDEDFRSAGDWEFWLRCTIRGATTFKSPYVTTAYFFNPNGLSTSKDQLGLIEGAEVRRRYAPATLLRAARSEGATADDPSTPPTVESLSQYVRGTLWQRHLLGGAQ